MHHKWGWTRIRVDFLEYTTKLVNVCHEIQNVEEGVSVFNLSFSDKVSYGVI